MVFFLSASHRSLASALSICTNSAPPTATAPERQGRAKKKMVHPSLSTAPNKGAQQHDKHEPLAATQQKVLAQQNRQAAHRQDDEANSTPVSSSSSTSSRFCRRTGANLGKKLPCLGRQPHI